MRFYGLASLRLREVVEFYADRDSAEEALREALSDEPEWKDELRIVSIDLDESVSGASRN